MNNITIAVGNALLNVATKDSYRVICVGNGYIGSYKINSNKIEIEYLTAKSVGLKLRNNLLEVLEEETFVFDGYRSAYNEKKLIKLVCCGQAFS